ncbi:hypothetical protein QY883_04440 [Pediococcus acidilactici]|uniref:hypothetical protein n=1 Tax=Pediococcus acidilactici TaxID=1254 RepID=UPI000326FB1D|nr:hypothetical protein [Pediococcus acidilactici]EOA09497.1 hypothetical protein PAD3_0590 [Pediococcus acidilactici D3]MBW4796970.1 hypothetical protein [Pediococcus acidilactici]MBW9306224.1 hypothetical protein [Pediococcus acidilactici]MCE5961355.1 hypothetical protein [Pediococcus acidilactici]MCW8082286.1 hypothetical protein [Pediococcus acidilactici]
MKLVKIDNSTYVDSESIGAIEDGRFGTNIYLTGSDKPIETLAEIEKVLDAICGSEEHLVNDANMNILKAESINSGHLNQQKCPSR